MATPSFDDLAPTGSEVTSYDERHRVTYWRLLDAAAENADWQEAVALIFGIDPAHDQARAKSVYDSHLARARWMAESGYRHYLRPPAA